MSAINKDIVEEDGVSWIKTTRKYQLEHMGSFNNKGRYEKNLQLTEKYEKCHNPPGFKTTLLPHQKTTVKAMLDLERERYVKVEHYTLDQAGYSSAVIETSAGVLSDKLGSGKTYDILSLCAWDRVLPLPKSPLITNVQLPTATRIKTRRQYKMRENYHDIGTHYEVRRIYKKFLPFTMVFVAKSVLLQWQKAIIDHTDLKVFMIENLFSLRTFHKMIFNPDSKNNLKKLCSYDIILIKNGNISGSFEPQELRGSHLEGNKTKPILTVIGELLKNFCVSRVVLDDFDTLGIPTNAHAIPALFTWFVSATKKTAKPTVKEYKPVNMQDAITNYRPPYVSVWGNRNLFTFFNIGSHEAYIDKSTQASRVEFFTYRFHNPNDNFINLLGQMGTEDAQLVMEALNGDAVMTAAGAVGIKSTSVADIFERVLDKKWDIYKHTLNIDKYITQVRPFIEGLAPKTPEQTAYTSKTISGFRKNLKKPGPFSKLQASLTYYVNSLDTTLDEIDDENKINKEESGRAIQRVKDNLREGDCPITAEPLSECEGVVILKCCGVVISSEAAEWSLKLRKTSGDTTNIAGDCPNCRQTIGFSKLILIDKEIDLSSIIEEEGLLNSEPEPEPEPESSELDETILDDFLDDEEEDEELTKFNMIVRIITGRDNTPEVLEIRKKRDDIYIPNMLIGKFDKGESDDRKTLVYANYGETLDRLQEVLIRKGVTFVKLLGSPRQIADMVARFNLPSSNPESISVLLINGPQYCAGLNLQVATDLIFTHKIVDPNVESQVGGRPARYGRTSNLRVHYCLYDNEFEYMFGRSGIHRHD